MSPNSEAECAEKAFSPSRFASFLTSASAETDSISPARNSEPTSFEFPGDPNSSIFFNPPPKKPKPNTKIQFSPDSFFTGTPDFDKNIGIPAAPSATGLHQQSSTKFGKKCASCPKIPNS